MNLCGKTAIIKIILPFFLLIVSNGLLAGTLSNWELVYENDAQGSPVSGNIEDLTSAIFNGSDVKVVLHFTSDFSHWSMPCEKVNVDTGKNIITCIKSGSVLNDEKTNISSAVQSFMTTGEYKAVYYTGPTSNKVRVWNVSMSWYVSN